MNEMLVWSPGVTLASIEKQVILLAFRFYRGNHESTAIALGISKRTLYNKLGEYTKDTEAEEERQVNERTRREQFLARQRGIVPDNTFIASKAQADEAAEIQRQVQASNGSATGGVRLESAEGLAAQPTVSVPKRTEVQSVLPAHSAVGHPKKSR